MGCRCCRHRSAQDDKKLAEPHLDLEQDRFGDVPQDQLQGQRPPEWAPATGSRATVTNLDNRRDAYNEFLCRIQGEYAELSVREHAVFVCRPGELSRRVSQDGFQIAAALIGNTELKELTMSCDLRDGGATWMASVLRQNRVLRFLDLSSNAFSYTGAAELANALSEQNTLLELNLRDNKLEDRGAQSMSVVLRKNRALTSLDLGSNRIGFEGMAAITSALTANSTLRCLKLSFANMSLPTVHNLATVLRKNTSLVELDLSYINYLLENEDLREDTAIEMAYWFRKVLRENQTLVKLDLSHNGIDAESLGGIQTLLQEKKERQICLRASCTGLWLPEDVVEVTPTALGLSAIDLDILPDLTTAGEDTTAEFLWRIQGMYEDPDLRTSACLILCPGEQADRLNSQMTLVVLTLLDNVDLKDLTLSCGFGDAGARSIAEVIRQNAVLRRIDIASNDISADGATSLACALNQNTTLTELNLRNNNLGDFGAKMMARVIRTSGYLETLDLGSNSIGSEGISALAKALKANTTLRHFRLSFTEFNNVRDVVNFSSVIENSTTLVEIDLSYNNFLAAEETRADIAAAMADHFLDALGMNANLQQLHLGHNSIDASDLAHIDLLLAKNKAACQRTNPSSGGAVEDMQWPILEEDVLQEHSTKDQFDVQATTSKDRLEVQSTKSDISSSPSDRSSESFYSDQVALERQVQDFYVQVIPTPTGVNL